MRRAGGAPAWMTLVLPPLAGAILAVTPLAAPAQDGVTRAPAAARTIAIDEGLAADAHLGVGDRVLLSQQPGGIAADTYVVAGITRRGADPSEIARAEYRVRMHLTDLQGLTHSGDRVDRFAVATRGPAAQRRMLDRVNDVAFGFHAYPSSAIAVRTSKTFRVLNRFHQAIGAITIVASAIFLLCILLLKVDERRRDVAALRLMGVSARSVVSSVVMEAALISLVGSLLGVAVGRLGSGIINWHYQAVYRTPLLFSLVTPSIVTFAVSVSIALGVIAGLAAAVRLVRIPPLTLFGR